MTRHVALELLQRQDKWYLGNGGMLVFAPPFPQHLRVPGFWDECHYGDIAVPRLLALSFALETVGGTPRAAIRRKTHEFRQPISASDLADFRSVA